MVSVLKKHKHIILSVTMGICLSIIFIDIVLYCSFNFHINFFVLHLSSSIHGLHSIGLSLLTYSSFFIGVCILIFLEFIFVNKHYKEPVLKIKFLLCGLFCLSFGAGVITNIWLVSVKDRIEQNNEDYRDYYELFKLSFFHDYRYISREKLVDRDYGKAELWQNKQLKYVSKRQPQFVFFVVIESWRKDYFSKIVTPNIANFSQSAVVFLNHHSASNCTRFGLFSLYYGIHPVSWWSSLSQFKGPLLIDELIRNNYQPLLMSSEKIIRPEFDKTIFVNVPPKNISIYDDSSRSENDARVIDRTINLVNNLVNNGSKDKHFISVLLNSSHFPYSFPGDNLKYKINIGKKDPARTNRYKQAISYIDNLVGKLLDRLTELKIMDNSIILITGDHGEALGESGFWGHAKSFTNQEVETPLVLYVPNETHREVFNKTIHTQVPSTILELLGVKNNYSDYSVAPSLLSDIALPFLTVCEWYECSIFTDNKRLIFSHNSNIEAGNIIEIRDAEYNLLPFNEINESEILEYYFQANQEFFRF